MNKNSRLIRTIVEIGLFAAIGFVLDELQGIAFASVFTAGGSIGFAMIAVLIIAYRRGWLPAMFVGLIMGVLDLITKAYFITFWQVLLDYILPYALVAVAGFFKPWFDKEQSKKKKVLILVLSTVAGGLLKFLSHFIVGTLVWAPMGYEWPIQNKALYSFAYNIAFTGPSIILSAAILVGLYLRAPFILELPQEKETPKPEKRIKAFDYIINPAFLTIGLFLFVFYLIVYIQNYQAADKGYAIKITSNPEAVMLMFSGLLLALICGINMILTFKNKQNNRLTCIALIVFCVAQIIYSVAKILICYLDDWQDPKIFFIWMVVSIALTALSVALFVFTNQFLKEDKIKTE